jgi:predicted PurR-regulated permease PerM
VPFVDVTVTQESITTAVKNGVHTFGTAFLRYVSSTVTSVSGFITALIVYIYLFLALLKHGKSLLAAAKALNPLGDDISDIYISRATAMIHGTVKGQFIIALIQGLIGAMTFAAVGYSQFFFILFLLFSVLSIIPLGAGIIAMPLAIIMMLFGKVLPGIVVLVEHLLINTNVDNILRPVLVPKEARLDPALMMVSVFAGIRFFGFLGLVIGPTLMILIVTTIRVYLQVKKTEK